MVDISTIYDNLRKLTDLFHYNRVREEQYYENNKISTRYSNGKWYINED